MGTAEQDKCANTPAGTFLFAVARWGQRNTGPAAMSARCTSFYSLSRDGDSGTTCGSSRTRSLIRRFYSLSRDGDSGTAAAIALLVGFIAVFLFAVARWGQRNGLGLGLGAGLGLGFLFAVARWGQRNRADLRKWGLDPVSIRCREMGTAELRCLAISSKNGTFLFAVARWGQRNKTMTTMLVIDTTKFLFAVARWGQRNRP